MKNIITEKTLIPLSLVAAVIGSIFWLTSMWNMTKANAMNIDEIKIHDYQVKEKILNRLIIIEKKLSNIEGKLSH